MMMSIRVVKTTSSSSRLRTEAYMKKNKEVKNMNILQIQRIGIGLMSIVLLSGLTWAADKTQLVGTLGMPLFRDAVSARAQSMGSAVVGMPMGSASSFVIPAGLGLLDSCMEVGLHHNSGLGESNHETAVVSKRLGIFGGFAASLKYVNNGTFEGRDALGVRTADYTAGDMGGSVGWGKQFFNHIAIGAALRYNRQTLGSYGYSAYGADAGLLYCPVSRLNLGVTYSNLGTEADGVLQDAGWRVGASYGIKKDLTLLFSSELKPAGYNRLQVGIENYISEKVAVRAGYVHNYTNTKLEGINGLSAGVGIEVIKNLVLDYAYIPYGDLGISNRISVTYKFLCPKEAPPVAVLTPAVQIVEAPPEIMHRENVVILEKLIVLEDTHFEFDSATLTINGAKIVIENTQILKDNPEAKIRVAGYTSAAGTAEYNQKLSERRAVAVRAILLNVGGIAPERITTIGYGETRPAMFEPIPKNIDSKEARSE